MIRTHIDGNKKEILGSTFSWHINCPFLSYCCQFWQFEKTKRNTGKFHIEAYYMIGNAWIWVWENEREEVKK